VESRPEGGFLWQISVICRRHEASQEPATEVAHISVSCVHCEQARLITTEGRIRGWAAKDLGPIGGEPFDVLGVLVRMGEGMVELKIRETAGVMRPSQAQEGTTVASCEIVQGWPHGRSLTLDANIVKTCKRHQHSHP